MALKGTLKDFGIADILQLIGQQQKTGVLVLTQKQDTVAVTFREGNIVRAETTLTPLRAESVLMEGFRRVDEWPVVRKRITSLQMTFEKLKELPPEELKKDDFDAALDDAFAEEKKAVNKGEFQSVGENERKAYNLIAPGRTVQRIIELSALGEFETAKALCNLINLEYAKGVPPAGKGGEDFEADGSRASAVLGMVGRIAVTMVVVGALLFIGTRIDFGAVKLGGSNATTYTDPAAQRFASQQQRSRLATAIDLFKLEKGALPIGLGELVEAELLTADDLHFPWREQYFYRRGDDGTYVLLPPLR